jgi:plasmid stabilization system protein ParE
MKVIIRPGARSDILDAAFFYDEQEPGLGDEVIDFPEEQIDDLANFAGIHPLTRGFHRAVLRGRFPHYCIYYTIKKDEVHVTAVLDQRRDPRRIRRRLSKEDDSLACPTNPSTSPVAASIPASCWARASLPPVN